MNRNSQLTIIQKAKLKPKTMPNLSGSAKKKPRTMLPGVRRNQVSDAIISGFALFGVKNNSHISASYPLYNVFPSAFKSWQARVIRFAMFSSHFFRYERGSNFFLSATSVAV